MASGARPQQQSLLREHLTASLAVTYELAEYSLYLRSSPACFACLVLEDADAETVSSVVKKLRLEWEFVLQAESNSCEAAVLAQYAPHTKWQVFRELHTALEDCNYKPDKKLRTTVDAWFPAYSGSANVEQLFGGMADSLKRGTRAEVASLPNLMSVGVRSFERRLCTDDNMTAISLSPQDFDGPEVRALKEKMWRPACASACVLVCVDLLYDISA